MERYISVQATSIVCCADLDLEVIKYFIYLGGEIIPGNNIKFMQNGLLCDHLQ